MFILKPDFPENKEDWPLFWGENEYVVDLGARPDEWLGHGPRLRKGGGKHRPYTQKAAASSTLHR